MTGLTTMNPEFKRNLWQELTLQRLIAMPAILLAIFFIVYFHQGLAEIPNTALNLIVLLLVVWGSGLSADAIFQEIREHTWDTQRMTPIGPWAMAWGKLFGSTIFVWYGAFWCLLAILFTLFHKESINYPNLDFAITYYLLTGVFTQAFSLFIALLLQRISPLRTRARVVLIQFFAIGVGLSFFVMGRHGLPEVFKLHNWYNLGIDYQTFVTGSQLFFCFSLFFGIYRLLRNELQIKSFPWTWSLFLLVLSFYLIGFLNNQNSTVSELNIEVPKADLNVARIGIAYAIILQGTFLAAFFTPKNIIPYFRSIKYFKQKNFVSGFLLTPPWILSSLLALISLLVFIYLLKRPDFSQPRVALLWIGLSISLLFFLMRDIGLLYYLTFDAHAKRAHLATVVYLIVLYTILPMLLAFTDIPHYWHPVLAPWTWFMSDPKTVSGIQVFSITFLVFLQAIIAWAFVATRWQSAKKKLA